MKTETKSWIGILALISILMALSAGCATARKAEEPVIFENLWKGGTNAVFEYYQAPIPASDQELLALESKKVQNKEYYDQLWAAPAQPNPVEEARKYDLPSRQSEAQVQSSYMYAPTYASYPSYGYGYGYGSYRPGFQWGAYTGRHYGSYSGTYYNPYYYGYSRSYGPYGGYGHGGYPYGYGYPVFDGSTEFGVGGGITLSSPGAYGQGYFQQPRFRRHR